MGQNRSLLPAHDVSRTLVLLRHGQSLWNKENLFTGWTDVDLTEDGMREGRRAGVRLAAAGYNFDVCFTSVLKRAIKTLHVALEEMDLLWLTVHKSWRLNERHYGALQGLNKAETAECYGKEQVFAWRRSWDVSPPPLEIGDKRQPANDRRYASVPSTLLPRSESLKDTVDRVMPYWHEAIAPALRRGERVLVVAHGNSLRGLVKFLSEVPDKEIPEFEMPTGRPLITNSMRRFGRCAANFLNHGSFRGSLKMAARPNPGARPHQHNERIYAIAARGDAAFPLALPSRGKGSCVSHHAAELSWDVHSPELRNFVIETSGYHAQPIPLIRRAIFFYDLPDRVLPRVVGDLHHAPSPRRLDEEVRMHFLAPTFPTNTAN